MEKVLAIIGPTASGKTALSVDLAREFDGEIISGDAMQVYRGLNIGTAKITPEEMAGIPHYLIDTRDPHEHYSVRDFQKESRDYISKINQNHHLAMLVGGTGLYIRACLYDYHFDDEGRRPNFARRYQALSNEKLHEHLQKLDPESARNIHPNNRQRVLRAIEIYETTGQKKSVQIAADMTRPLYDVLMIGLTMPRPLLFARINARVEDMLKDGLYEEFLALNLDKDLQCMQAIGYKELFAVKEGKSTLEEAKEKIALDSRRYAKRQMTWFKKQDDVVWLEVDPDNFESCLKEAEKLVTDWLNEDKSI